MSTLLEIYPDCASWTDISENRYVDIDQQAACLAGYDQEYRQLSAGRYRGWFKTVLLGPHVGFYFETFNQMLDQWGACPGDRYSFIFLMDQSPGCRQMGRAFDAGSILCMTPGGNFDFQCAPGTRFCVISIDADVFEKFLAACLSESVVSNHRASRLGIVESQTKADTLRQVTRLAMQLAEDFAATPSDRGTLAGFQTSLISLLVSFVSDLVPLDRALDGYGATARTAHEARNHIRTCGAENMNTTELALRLGVSRRSLEYAFRAQFDKSPTEYIRLIRLNRIRSELLNDANQDLSIGDIAARFGVWHLSRLAHDYRLLFGELPSETRRSGRKDL